MHIHKTMILDLIFRGIDLDLVILIRNTIYKLRSEVNNKFTNINVSLWFFDLTHILDTFF